jgi:hypothetical protein
VATVLALVPTQTTEHVGWVFYPPRQDEWFGQVVEIPFSRVDVAQGAQPIERAAVWRRGENRYSTSPIRDFDCFALFDPSEELAGALSEFPDTYGSHVLLIAQF